MQGRFGAGCGREGAATTPDVLPIGRFGSFQTGMYVYIYMYTSENAMEDVMRSVRKGQGMPRDAVQGR